MIGGIFRLGYRRFFWRVALRPRLIVVYGPALFVAPEDARQGAAPGRSHLFHAPQGVKVIVLAAFYGESFAPMASQALAVIGANDEAAAVMRASIFLHLELGSNLVARRGGLPAVGLKA